MIPSEYPQRGWYDRLHQARQKLIDARLNILEHLEGSLVKAVTADNPEYKPRKDKGSKYAVNEQKREVFYESAGVSEDERTKISVSLDELWMGGTLHSKDFVRRVGRSIESVGDALLKSKKRSKDIKGFQTAQFMYFSLLSLLLELECQQKNEELWRRR